MVEEDLLSIRNRATPHILLYVTDIGLKCESPRATGWQVEQNNQNPYPPQQGHSPYGGTGYPPPQPSYDGAPPPSHSPYGGAPGYGPPQPIYDNAPHQQGQYDHQRDGGYPQQNQGGYPQQQQQQQQGAYGGPGAYADPNAPPGGAEDGERGLGKAALGAMGGGLLGHKLGGHGILGALGGAIAANVIGGSDKDKYVVLAIILRSTY